MKTAKQLFADIGWHKRYGSDEDETHKYITYESKDEDEIKFKISKIDNNHSIELIQYTWPDICTTEINLHEILYPIIKQLEEYNIDIKDIYFKKENVSYYKCGECGHIMEVFDCTNMNIKPTIIHCNTPMSLYGKKDIQNKGE